MGKRFTRAVFDIETTALEPGKGGIITIGVARELENGDVEGNIFSAGAGVKHPDRSLKQPKVKEQVDIIRKLADFLSEPGRNAVVYTFNGFSFDFPWIRAKAIHANDYGELGRRLAQLEIDHHADLMEIYKRIHNRDINISLEDAAHHYGIETGKHISGKDVPRLYHEGKLDVIKKYQEQDVEETYSLALKLEEELSNSSKH